MSSIQNSEVVFDYVDPHQPLFISATPLHGKHVEKQHEGCGRQEIRDASNHGKA
jgi:hypothetical protein